MMRLMIVAWVWLAGLFATVQGRRSERGDAVSWLLVVGAGIGIAYFAQDAVMSFAKSVAARLGQ
jgi:hypothetical protein